MTGFEVHIETTVRVSPALAHLTDARGRATLLTQACTLRAPSQQALEELLPDALAQTAARAGHMVLAHPQRPSYSDKRLLQFLQFTHDVNVGAYPYVTPTPPEHGHTQGSWLDCQLCAAKLTEEAPE